jgi:peptidoglycan/LPS O-acetylase OafA/YrhL
LALVAQAARELLINRRIPSLDGVRGVAILMVLVWHYVACQVTTHSGKMIQELSLGWSGVDLFFVLSGFLIAGILIDHRSAPNYFQIFYIRRICRIFPVYFLVLGAFVISSHIGYFSAPRFSWLVGAPMPILSYVTFTQNFFMGWSNSYGANWLGMTWSLAIEEQFYLVVPILIYFLPRRLAFYVLAVGVLVAPILRCAWPGFFAFVGTPWRADSLFSGACLAFIVRSQLCLELLVKHRGFIMAWAATMFAGTICLLFKAKHFGQFDHLWLAGLYSSVVLISTVYIDNRVSILMANPILGWFGRYSYGIYMFHQPMSGLLHGMIRNSAPGIQSVQDAGVTLLAFVSTLILAVISYHCMERPILSFGHRFIYADETKRARVHEDSRVTVL